MNKTIMTLAATAMMLSACHTTQTAYDERPANKQPVLERPAWPNYDLHDDRSFAAFSHIHTADDGKGKYLQTEENRFVGPYKLYRCKDATYLCYDFTIPEQQDWFFFRFTEGSAIIDADTGDRYLLQHLEHFPINQCFWIYGQKTETIRIILVFPPLPPKVKHIQIYEASAESRRWMDGKGSLTKPVDINYLRAKTVTKPAPKQKQGRIIR